MKLRRSNITLPFLLQKQIELDENKDLNELIKREREIGKKTIKLSKKKQLFNWLQTVADEDLITYQAKLLKGNLLVKLFLVLAGFASGGFFIYGLCNYREKIPTNLILLLGLFFLIQLTSFLFLFFASNYSLTGILTNLTPVAWKAFSKKNNIIFSKLKKKFTVYLAQIFSISFFTGAILTFLTLVVVTDLAFSWSSSLDITSKKVYSITSSISRPWNDFVEHAVPTEELVENSRYYKLQDKLEKFEAKVYGYWWPFVVMSLIVYGLIPRIFTYLYSLINLNKTITNTALIIPGVNDVLDRMNSKVVSLSSSESSNISKDSTTDRTQSTEEKRKKKVGLKFEQLALKQNTEVLIWSEACKNNYFNQHSKLISNYHSVGVLKSTKEDNEIIKKVSSSSNILIIVKSWEPPKAEFTDFLKQLRSALGEAKTIGVLAISLENQNLKEIHKQAWSLALKKLNDAWIRLYYDK